MDNWKQNILKTGYQQVKGYPNIIQGKITETLALNFHKKMPKGAALRELRKERFHLAYWETPYYNEAITKFINSIKPENSIVADIGCGDGRFTELLLRLGYKMIIATDIDINPLISLHEYIKETGNEDNILLINTGVEDLPIFSNVCDAILSIGVLYYLNENYETGLKELNRILKYNGILINSEPDLEGAIYKSIFFESLNDVYENYFHNTFKEEKGETPYKFRLFTETELMKILNENGFDVINKYGLSLFSSIIRIMMLRNQIDKLDLKINEKKIRTVMDYLNGHGKLNKHIIWQSQKR